MCTDTAGKEFDEGGNPYLFQGSPGGSGTDKDVPVNAGNTPRDRKTLLGENPVGEDPNAEPDTADKALAFARKRRLGLRLGQQSTFLGGDLAPDKTFKPQDQVKTTGINGG